MFKINDYIIYGSTGICQITDIRDEKFGRNESKTYYIINPIYVENSTIYAPVGLSESKMKKAMSVEEAYDLIKTIPEDDDVWVDDDNQRKDKFSKIIKGGDRAELVTLIRTLYNKKEEKINCGKKVHTSDEKFMKEAEKLLYEELALVLNIEREEVIPFIAGEIEVNKKELKDLNPNG